MGRDSIATENFPKNFESVEVVAFGIVRQCRVHTPVLMQIFIANLLKWFPAPISQRLNTSDLLPSRSFAALARISVQ